MTEGEIDHKFDEARMSGTKSLKAVPGISMAIVLSRLPAYIVAGLQGAVPAEVWFIFKESSVGICVRNTIFLQ